MGVPQVKDSLSASTSLLRPWSTPPQTPVGLFSATCLRPAGRLPKPEARDTTTRTYILEVVCGASTGHGKGEAGLWLYSYLTWTFLKARGQIWLDDTSGKPLAGLAE